MWELHVTVVDAKTKKPSARVFVIVDATRIFRGQATVALAAANIQKGESVAVTVDHESRETRRSRFVSSSAAEARRRRGPT